LRGIGQTPAEAPAQLSKPLPPIIGGVIIVGVVGLIGWLIYNSVQERKRILETEGSTGLLKYEAGTAAIGVGSALAHRMIDGGHARRNGRRSRRRRRLR
jgi:H+/Cl- antiporter ClcA